MKPRVLVLAFAIGFAPTMHASTASLPTTPTDPAATSSSRQLWAAWGGTVEMRWNRDLARDVGMRISAPRDALPGLSFRLRDRFDLQRSGSLAFHVERGYFRGFDGGSLQAHGGYTIELPDGSRLDYSDFRLRPSANDPLILDFVGSDGKAWFYIDRLMYELLDHNRTLAVRTMDLRISPQLAQRIGHPEVARWAIADVAMTTDVLITGTGAVPLATHPHWPGDPAPDGGLYQADLFMQSFSMQYSRCQGCSGPSGTGRVVFTPTSLLQNNVNGGTLEVTIPGQGSLGTSAALWAAGIAWNQMFSGIFPPYGNDQHAYLIWNLYRTNADGSIEQIGRSGAKHAFLTVNSDCLDADDHDDHILGRGCSDTYGVSNNDSNSDLGPRSEIVAATGIWGRCGSIYDPDCTGTLNDSGNGDYDQRLVVGEQQISATVHPGASYLFESWYIDRDDIDPYNSMATVTGAPNWSGSVWSPGGGSNYKLGPAIDRWADPANPTANARSTELASNEGHAKLAVKVTAVGGGVWRYDYAVMNLDFARAVSQGSPPNVRVVSNRGFNRLSVPLPAGALVSATRFSDGDLDAGNDWAVSTSGGKVTWTAPSGNTLDWGTLFSFSLSVDKAPAVASGEVGVAQAGSPSAYPLLTLAPSTPGTPLPSAAVAPSSISLSVIANGNDASAPLTVSNVGAQGSALLYQIGKTVAVCGSGPAIPWLDASPATGSVGGGGSQTVTVTASNSGLGPGSYSAKLCVMTSDPAHASIEVPVALTVTATVGGTVGGMTGSGLVLKLNGGNNLAISANGPFTFPDGLARGTAYTVTIGTQPSNPAQTCAVAHASGTIASANVTDVAVTCGDLIFADGFDGGHAPGSAPPVRLSGNAPGLRSGTR